MSYTKPGPSRACETCRTYGLRTYTEPASQEEKVVCTNMECPDSPLHREE